jgi:hypothetical protein
MKQQLIRFASRSLLFLAIAGATCVSGSPVQAQSLFRGKFTLPYEARWGQAVLPAGNYTLSMGEAAASGTMLIREAKSGRTVAQIPTNIAEDSKAGNSALLIVTRGGKHIIYTLRLAETGQMFVSDPELARQVREQEKETKVIPILQAKN